MAEIEEMREFLISEGERVQREIANYAQLNQSVALAATKIKAETVGAWKGTAIAAEAHSVAKQLSKRDRRVVLKAALRTRRGGSPPTSPSCRSYCRASAN
jgi:hypothetical protein